MTTEPPDQPVDDPFIPAEPLRPAGVAPDAGLEPPTMAPPLEPVPPAPLESDPIPLVPTRALLGASFDLLGRAASDMRRASFYVGAIVLGTVGPLVLSMLVLLNAGLLDLEDPDLIAGGPAMISDQAAVALLLVGLLGFLAVAGLMVASVEGRNLGIAVLGSTLTGRPVTTRQALARSRTTFWRAVGAAFLATLPLLVVQTMANAVLEEILVEAADVSVIVSTALTAVIGAPFAYALAGVVLGDVGPVEAVRRSFRVYKVRKAAASIIVVFETITTLLIVAGLSEGLGIAIRIFEALGIGPDTGGLGFLLSVLVSVLLVFAFGTLLFTVSALTVAPQVVMFLGLTHASGGLDRVRPGGRDDPDRIRRLDGPFRWFTVPMIGGFIAAAVGLVSVVAIALG